MEKGKDYIFLSLMIPKELSAEVEKNSIKNMADAANTLEYNLAKGFARNLSAPFKIVNILPIGNYPQYYKKLFVRSSRFTLGECVGNENLGFCNIKLFRNYFVERAVLKRLKILCQEGCKEKVLCIYSASSEFLGAAAKVKKMVPRLTICDIIADIPEMANLSSNKSALLRWYITYKAKKSLKRMKCVDCFVLLTEQMAGYLHIDKPYCVMEGIAPETQERKENSWNGKKMILYSGTLHRKFGIMNLVNAFQRIKDPNYQLVICGIGDCENAIREASQKDSRISFLGKLPRSKVLQLQAKACVLVNPRQNNEIYTKYSFPSKTLEYLASGIPVIAYKLDGIPDEYDAYLQYVKDNSIESLANKLLEICELSEEQRKKIGEAGRAFVLKEKNCDVQVKKIIELIESL